MSLREVFEYIKNNYPIYAYISDIARYLRISEKEANHLTFAAGFSYHKLKNEVSFEEWARDAEVITIYNKIKYNTI